MGDRKGTGDWGLGPGGTLQSSVARHKSQVPSSPEPLAPSPQSLAPSPQSLAPSPQSLAPSPQSLAPSPQSLYAAVYWPPAPGTVHVDRAAAGDAPSTPADSPLVPLAEEFSPRYELPRPDLLTIDIRGLERLLGSPRTIGEEIRREAADRGLRVHVAVAGTRTAAIVLALARPGLTVVRAREDAAMLTTLPLRLLARVPADRPDADREPALTAVTMLTQWGIRTLGELAALPDAALMARLGKGARRWQAIARGEDARPLIPLRPEERFEGDVELEWPIEGLEPLSFVLTRLLEPLSTRLERRDRGAAALQTVLHLVTGETHARVVPLPAPLREVRALRTLVLLDLESHPPPAAIDRVTLRIDPTPGRICQHALFTRPHPTPEQLSTLVARLNALLGQDRVGSPDLVDTHRPGAFALMAFEVDHDRRQDRRPQSPASSPQSPASSPLSLTSHLQPLTSALRRCRPPVPVRVTVDAEARPIRVQSDRRGYPGGMVTSAAGPWRTSGEWWQSDWGSQAGSDTGLRQAQAALSEPKGGTIAGCLTPGEKARKDAGGWDRDEWDVALAEGVVYRIFRDGVSDKWFLEGIVD